MISQRLFFLISAIPIDLCVLSQSEYSNQNVSRIDILRYVRDSFMKVGIPNAKITIMTLESVVIDTAHVSNRTRSKDVYDAVYNIFQNSNI